MLKSSCVKPCNPSRKIRLSVFLLLCPLVFQAQSLTGLWTGTVHNDSATARKDQLFEIALTEKDGKVTGYSRNEFIVDDTLYVIVKKVKGRINGSVCEVTDDGIVSCNFMDKVDKGVTVTSTFLLDPVKNNWYLSNWKTNVPRKKYYAVGGNMDMEAEKDLSASKLITHLEELNKATDLAIYREKTESLPIVRIAKPERIQTSYTTKLNDTLYGEIAVKEAVAMPVIPQPVEPAPQPVAVSEKKPEPQPVTSVNNEVKQETVVTNTPPVTLPSKTTTAKPAANPVVTTSAKPVEKSNNNPSVVATTAGNTKKPEAAPVVKNSVPAPQQKTEQPTVAVNNPKQTAAPQQAPAKPLPAPATTAIVTKVDIPATTANNEVSVAVNPAPVKTFNPPPGALVVKKPVEDPVKSAAVIAGRKSEFNQEVLFSSDSLVLSLYDNGEIDGDTVSVYLNGEVVMPAQGLKSSAIRKTIHMDHDIQSFTLVMFAESLGKYPPNTGLLVIRDGNDIYNLRFSSDFTKSTGIVFRRKQ